MRSEIGSEFWSVPVKEATNGLFAGKVRWFLSGRTALNHIIFDIRQSNVAIGKVALPSYCCHTMIQPFLDQNLEVAFYDVYPGKDKIEVGYSNAEDCDVILIMEYFGYNSDTNDIPRNKIIINDLTHSVFSEGQRVASDYYFGSLRKWASIACGGFSWKTDGDFVLEGPKETNADYLTLRRTAAERKEEYINECRQDKEYLSIFSEAEEMLEAPQGSGVYEFAGDEDSIRKAKHMDIESVKSIRRKNAEYLIGRFNKLAEETNGFIKPIFTELKEKDCPLFVPILVADGKRDELKRVLVQQEIYCPNHWPKSDLHKLNEKTSVLFDQELSIVCDQRYGLEHMERIADAISNYSRQK